MGESREFQTREEALAFLRAHQPMPSEADIDEAFYEQYGAAVRYFCDHPDPECLPLFLFSVRADGSPALAQDVDYVLQAHDEASVLEYLKQAMAHPHPDVRAQAAEYVMSYPRVELVESLRLMLLEGLDAEIEAVTPFVLDVLQEIAIERSHLPALELLIQDFYRNPRWTAYIKREVRSENSVWSNHLLFLKLVVEQADLAFQAHDHKRVIHLLEPFENERYGFLGHAWPHDPGAQLRASRDALKI